MRTLLLAIFVLSSYFCSAQDFTINNFDIDLSINSDGSIDIIEKIDVTFDKKKRGIYREIPTSYKINGARTTLGLRNIKVENEKSKISNNGSFKRIRIGDAKTYITGPKSYTISYTIANGIQNYEEHQELYIDLTGDRWKANIEKASYTINLPKSITLPENSVLVTTGGDAELKYGGTLNQINSKTLQGETNRILESGEGVTVAVVFPKNYLSVADMDKNPAYKKPKEKTPQNPWMALLPLGLLALFWDFWKKLRRKGDDIMDSPYQHYPPADITSAHVGAYIDQKANTRDIISLIPYWAAEGYIEMMDDGSDTHLIKKNNLSTAFPDYEHTVFNKLFEKNGTAKMNDINQKFYTTLSKAKSQLTKEVMSQGYYDEEYQKWFRTWRLAIFPMVLIVLGILSIVFYQQIILGVSTIVIGVIAPFFAIGKLPLSIYGKKMKLDLDGLFNFLNDMPQDEVDELTKKDPKYFDKMLPFAVAFGIEKNFIPKFENTLSSMPHWYLMSETMNPSRSFNGFQESFSTETINSAFTSYPASQSTGGSSSGGFSSGGGIGGGGGGSW